MKDLVIFGATSLAKLTDFYATNHAGYHVKAFVVDSNYKTQDHFCGHPILTWPDAQKIYTPDNCEFFSAIGYKNIRMRESVYIKIKNSGYKLANIICNESYVAHNVELLDNNIVMPGTVIEPFVRLGANNVFWSNVTLCHDSRIGSHNFFAANVTIGGGVTVGNNNFIGFSSTILQACTIGDDTLIGAQSLVNKNTASLSRYYGSPARFINTLNADTGVTVD